KEPYWCDYDQLGFNKNTLFLSCDMEPGSGTGAAFSRVRVITKKQFIDRACGAEPCSWWDLEHPTDANGQASIAIVPARMYDTGTGYEFLIDAERGSGNSVTLRRIDDHGGLCCDGNPSTRPPVEKWYLTVPAYTAAPSAPQKG